MPALDVQELREKFEKIDKLLEQEDFETAKFLLDDVIDSLKRVSERLENWVKIKKERMNF